MRNLKLAIIFVLFFSNCSENSSSSNLSSENEIKSFAIEYYSLLGKVNNVNNSIRIKVTPDINCTNLIPTIQISAGAAINPPSGAPQDFTDTLLYSVTSESGSTANYKVFTDMGNYILNSCLLIVHMQKHFIDNLLIHNREDVVNSISGILISARVEDIPVIFSKSQPAGDREIIDELKPNLGEKVIESANDQPVVAAMDSLKVKNVVVAGILTDACIVDVCTELKKAGFNVFLIEDATSVLKEKNISLIAETCKQLQQAGIVILMKANEVVF